MRRLCTQAQGKANKQQASKLTLIHQLAVKQATARARYRTARTAGMLNLRVSFMMSCRRRHGCTTGERTEGGRENRGGGMGFSLNRFITPERRKDGWRNVLRVA